MKLLGALLLIELTDLVQAAPASHGLADPAEQPLFTAVAPNPLDPSFIYNTSLGEIRISVGEGVSVTGLVDSEGNALFTPIWGYGTEELGHTWPGRTFEVQSEEPLRVINSSFSIFTHFTWPSP